MVANIDYEKISLSLNQFGNEIMNKIKSQYGYCIQNIDSIAKEDFIVIEKPTTEDIVFFSKQNGIEDPKEFSISNVPSAHGGRTKNDGKIHVYPYSPNSFGNCSTTEEIINICKNDIIIHEVFHYFIRPEIKYIEGSNEAEFGHFLTEGLVQGYAEQFAHNNNLPKPRSNYNNNVDLAFQLLSSMPEGMDINYMVFNSSVNELVNSSFVGHDLLNKYKDNCYFNAKLNSLIERSASIAGFTKDQIQGMKRYYSRINDKNQIIEELSDNIQTAFGDNNELSNEFIGELQALNTTTENKSDSKEEQHKTLEQEGPKLVRKLPQQSNNESSSSNNDGKISLTLIIIISLILLFAAIIGIYITL